MSVASSTDRIEKSVRLRASRARVWQALSDAREFGEWFGVRFDGPFVAGRTLTGVIVPTKADPDVAREQEPYAGTRFDVHVEQVEPQRLLSFRWHPYAVDANTDYSHEPTTLVVFTLEDDPDGVLLRVTESGFDAIPLDRRAAAFSANEGGWAAQMMLIEKHVAQHT